MPDVSLPTFQGPPGPRPAHIYVSVSVDFPSSPAGQQVASHHPSIRQMTCPRSGSEREGLQTPRPGSLHSPLCMEAPPSWAHLETLLQGTSCHQIPGPVPNPQPQGPHSSSGPGPRPPPSASWGLRLHWCSRSQRFPQHSPPPLSAPCHSLLASSPSTQLYCPSFTVASTEAPRDEAAVLWCDPPQSPVGQDGILILYEETYK